MSKVPITKAGAEMLRQELHRLKTVDRPNVVAAIAEARAHGDLSENAEYAAARERQSFIEGRIQEIEGKLGNAQIIDPQLLDADGRCVFGATVDLEDVESGDKVTYHEHMYEALPGADALFVVTEWNEFRNPDFDKMKSLMKSAVIFDGRNLYNPSTLGPLGYKYYRIGAPGVP